MGLYLAKDQSRTKLVFLRPTPYLQAGCSKRWSLASLAFNEALTAVVWVLHYKFLCGRRQTT